jgi:uncharacterized protein
MRAISVYLALTITLSSAFWALMIACGHVLGAHGAYATGLEWCPGAAALLTCAILRIDVATLGWHWRPWRWQILAYVTPLAICAVAYGVVWTTGLGGFPNTKTVADLRDSLGLAGLTTPEVILLWVALWLTEGSVRTLASTLGEGIGWSGFLAPRLAARYGFTKAALILGAIWASWHFPILLFADYFDNTSPAWFALPCFVIEVLGWSVILLWLRLRSGSLWTGALLNASVNVFNGLVFAPLTTPRGWITAYTIDDSGFMLPLVIVPTALLFWLRRKDVEPPRVLAAAQP